MNCLKVKSEDQVFKIVGEYIGARQDVADWHGELLSTCRFSFITPAVLESAAMIAEIPSQNIQLGMLARIHRMEYEKMPSGSQRQAAEKAYQVFIAKHSPTGDKAGDREARGDRLRARR